MRYDNENLGFVATATAQEDYAIDYNEFANIEELTEWISDISQDYDNPKFEIYSVEKVYTKREFNLVPPTRAQLVFIDGKG